MESYDVFTQGKDLEQCCFTGIFFFLFAVTDKPCDFSCAFWEVNDLISGVLFPFKTVHGLRACNFNLTPHGCFRDRPKRVLPELILYKRYELRYVEWRNYHSFLYR